MEASENQGYQLSTQGQQSHWPNTGNCHHRQCTPSGMDNYTQSQQSLGPNMGKRHHRQCTPSGMDNNFEEKSKVQVQPDDQERVANWMPNRPPAYILGMEHKKQQRAESTSQ